MCSHNPVDTGEDCEHCEHLAIVAALRESIQRQVDTTQAGKLLTAYDAAAMKSLVDNLVGNVYYVVVEFKKS